MPYLKKMQLKTRLLIIFSIGIIGFSGTAYACMCDDLTIEQRINQADVVFSGTISGDTWNFSEDSIAAGFDVRAIWKGSNSFPLIENGYVTVITAKVTTACGVPFIKNKEYLIYAKIDGDNLQTTTCDGSWFLDGRNGDVEILKNMGFTHVFVDARENKYSSSYDCKSPGLHSVEECEFGKLVRNIFLPVGIASPIVGVTVFFLWRKK